MSYLTIGFNLFVSDGAYHRSAHIGVSCHAAVGGDVRETRYGWPRGPRAIGNLNSQLNWRVSNPK